jgi:scyllo-inositol 2-dehydrogenase (NADP+)
MTKPLQTAIIGYGKSGKNIHTPLIDACDGIVLRSVVRRSGPEHVEGRSGIDVIRDYRDVLKKPEIDLVVITAPNHLHYNMARDALRAGKHVVVDKPFSVSSNEADELIAMAFDLQKTLTVFQNRRWDGDFLTVQKLIGEKAVGRIVEFESSFNRFRNELRENAWKEKALPGSGILYDLAPHLIDQALQLFGKPKKLFADIRNERGGETDDRFEIILFYDGFRATLRAGMLVPDPTPRFVLRGDKGSFVKFGTDPQEEALAAGMDPKSSGWGREEASAHGVLRREESGKLTQKTIVTAPGNYPHFYRKLADAILKGTPLSVKPEEAARVIRIIELALESHQKGMVIAL